MTGSGGDARSDTALATAAAAGDEVAFAVLYRRYEPVARRSAARAAARHPQLEVPEAVHLAMARLWEALPSYDPEREFAPWAAVVIAHAVRSTARHTRSVKSSWNWNAMLGRPADEDGPATGAPLEQVAAAPADGGLQQLLLGEEEQLVAMALQELLSPRESEAMRLRLAGWGYGEIGTRLGMGEKAVDNALRRAREKLRVAFTTPAPAAGQAEAGGAKVEGP